MAGQWPASSHWPGFGEGSGGPRGDPSHSQLQRKRYTLVVLQGSLPYSSTGTSRLLRRYCLDAPLPDGLGQAFVVAIGLRRVVHREFRDCLIEDRAIAHISCDHGRICRARVRERQHRPQIFA
jgi:hypothetical protein